MLEGIDGKKYSLHEFLKEGPVYLCFWALWCIPCRAELKDLNSIQTMYKDKKVTILAINIDSPKSTAKVRSYVSTQKFNFKVLLDPNSNLFETLSGKNLPYSLLVNQNGEIIKTRNSYLPGDKQSIIEDFDQILKSIK